MPLTKIIGKSLLLCALFAPVAGASTIIESTGNSGATEPVGNYPPYAQYNLNPLVFEVAWTQMSGYSNVDVQANLFSGGGGAVVDFALVDAIGPGTSFAANGIVEGSVATPANPTNVDLFQLPFLAAGTYYLVLSSTSSTTIGWQYNYPGTGSYSIASGVNYLGSEWSTSTAINTLYAPGSSFSGVNIPVEFQVTGNAATPEPATIAMAGLALLGLAAFGGWRKRLHCGCRPMRASAADEGA